jgi:hypothetical protein
MRFPRDLVAMLAAFADAGARYLVVGGHAVGVHARPRTTKDLDVWLLAGPENIARACEALRAFGAPASIVEDLRTAAACAEATRVSFVRACRPAAPVPSEPRVAFFAAGGRDYGTGV